QWQKTFQETFGEIKLTREEEEIQKQENLSDSKTWQRKYFTFVKKHFEAFHSSSYISSAHISSLPLKLAQDFHFIKQLQTEKYLPLKYIPADLKKNKEIVLAAVKQRGWTLYYAHEDLKKDKEIVLTDVKQNGSALEDAHEDFKKDKEIVLAAVKRIGEALKYAHEDLKKDREIVLAAVKQNGWALQYAHEDFKKDKEIVLAAVKQHGRALEYAHEDLKKDREIVLAAVKQDGRVLGYAHEDLKKDKEIVLAAVKQYGSALKYAHEDLKKNKEIVLAAVKQAGWALEYAHEDLKKDREIVLAAVKQAGWALEYAHEDLKKDREIVLAAVTQYGWALRYAHEDLKKDKEFVLAAVKQKGWALKYAHKDLKKDKEIVLAAVKQDGRALEYAHEDLKKDREIVLAAVKQDGRALEYVHEDLKKDKEFVLAAVKQNGRVLQYAHEDLKKDREIVLAAVTQSGWALEYAHEDLKKDKEVVLAADAVLADNSKVARELIKSGADTSLQNKEGKTALMHAVLADNSKVARELIKAGADTSLQDKEGKTALMHAAEGGNKENTKLLLKYSYVDKYDTWVKKIENEDTKEILEDACQKNSVLIQKIEDVISKQISNIKDINENSLGDIEKKFVQEEFDERLYKLEQDQYSRKKELGNKIDLINEKLKKVKDKTDVVYEKYQMKLDLLNEQRKLYFNPSIRTFYFTIQALFETRLISMMLLLGGIIKRVDSTTEKTLGGVTEVATAALEVIPVAGAMLGSGITVAVREMLGKMGDDIKIAQAKRIQKSLGNPKGATKFAEFAARKVTQKYEEVIRSKKISVEHARRAGERVAKQMFKVINDERNSVFDYFFVNNVLIKKIDERHKKKNLFEDKSTKKKASKGDKKQVAELSRDQQNMRKELELVKEQQREFKITQFGQPVIEQFNSIIKDDFPKSKKTENIFEIVLNEKKLTLKLCDDRKSYYLKKLSKYSFRFSKRIIKDWKITHESIQIEVKFTHIAEDLKEFFEKSNLPIKIGV
ncbi:MAG: hypothetical protein KR126chlam5_00647, partial [Candidatus Anoxychlamydiales bacterium]|nr:hypothetical protein [Candidatus Anoxychlamydiales bacterium]